MVINHGTFTQYTPTAPVDPEPNTAAARLADRMGYTKLFAKRADGADWYDTTSALDVGFYGIVIGGKVYSASTDPTAFGVYQSATLLQSTGEIIPGWSWDGQTLRPPEAKPLSGDDVDKERDRRMATFVFHNVAYDFDAESRENIQGAYVLAQAAVLSGKAQGDLRWFSLSSDFKWIAADNSLVTMDAQTTMAFGAAAASWKSAHIFAGRTLKDMTPIPPNYTDNSWWPT